MSVDVDPDSTGTTLQEALGRNGHTPGTVGVRGKRSWWRRNRLLWTAIGLSAAVLVGVAAATKLAAPPKPAAIPVTQALTSRGVVQPAARASIATLSGGIVEQLPVQAGQIADARQLLARISLPGQTELLVAPWRGTVTGTSVHLGDSLMPGTVVATMADLSRYQVETTDVDEYLIGHIWPNQPVSMTVEALDRATMRGFVKSVSLQQQTVAGGSNYPIVIDLAGPYSNLRPGMTVRVTFLEADA
jgi:multidrug efflux pump subunit AcrA (membrane-fusion protein)